MREKMIQKSFDEKQESFSYTLYDCHNHTWHSHDSQCDPEILCQYAVKKGLSGIAFTDHCDIEYANCMDIQAEICRSAEESHRYQVLYKGRMKILTGIEIGEGIWDMEETKRILKMKQYDIVLGSVHAVRSIQGGKPYSAIDFSKFSSSELDHYLVQYFYDVLEMAKKCDFDVLTHLTCPLRYITGKYGIAVDLSKYRRQMQNIFEKIMERNIALEVNTSNKHSAYDAWLPEQSIVEMYYKLGGFLITVGSDAHIAENTGYMFHEACDMLRKVGFKRLYYYEKRHPVPYDLF